VAALLLSPAASSRTQALALLLYADGAAVALALLAALPAAGCGRAALADIRDACRPSSRTRHRWSRTRPRSGLAAAPTCWRIR
jgi:hypothetical protein